ncbi:metalloendopeptidase-like membrane protein [Desulfosporosinus acidiphilus SJ4]|uniref:Metalloendopeptidase-like membrane protein n=1 Tax=Desulfosporosinus acidiphilus (strain DSM 22704 / JCM 16185 / SJ4) TaxID=646529 RepID=I4DCD1_DESAJ|nr:M23 family metallopeptidase [Desulfosporosinus acidiphilus]AFM43455.1 metalloendopeptidase-like membrane protein [Desulfosporosinus acidiphilus SJ4]
MIRWRGSLSWILVWLCSIMIGIGILSFGYFDTSLKFISEKESLKTNSEIQSIALQKETKVQQRLTKDSKTNVQLKAIKEPKTVAESKKAANLNTHSAENIVILTNKDFPSPVRGRLLRGIENYYNDVFKSYLFHPGEDFAEPEGTVIRATHPGKVIFAGSDLLLGQKVVLDCGQGWTVVYGGLENLRVQAGQIVEMQGLIGQVGFSPGAEGVNNQSQLHYEVLCGNKVEKSGSEEGNL